MPCLLYGSFSKEDARSQSDTVVAVAGSRPRFVVCYMAASAKKTLARNLTLCRSRWLTSKVRRLLYGSFSKKDARSQSDTVLAVAGSRPRCVVCYMTASAKKTLARNLTLCRSCWLTSSKPSSAIWQLQQKKTLARNLTLSLQSLAHIEGVCYMAASAKKTLAI